MFERLIAGRDIITSPADTVRPTDGVKRVIALLCTHRIREIPVVDNKCHVEGLISERNLLESVDPKRQELRQAGARASSPGAERAPTLRKSFRDRHHDALCNHGPPWCRTFAPRLDDSSPEDQARRPRS